MKSVNVSNTTLNDATSTMFDSQSGLGIVFPTNPMKMISSPSAASATFSSTTTGGVGGAVALDGYRYGNVGTSSIVRRSSLLPAGFMCNPIFDSPSTTSTSTTSATRKPKRKHESLSDVLRTAEEVMEMSFVEHTFNNRRAPKTARTTAAAVMDDEISPFDDSWFNNQQQQCHHHKIKKPNGELPMAADLLDDVFGGSTAPAATTAAQQEAEEPDMFLQALKRYDPDEMMMSSVSSLDTGFMDNNVVTDNDDSIRSSGPVPVKALSCTSSPRTNKKSSTSRSSSSPTPPPPPAAASACYKEEQWNERYQELVEYTKLNGHCLVKHQWSKNRPLAQWVKRQRYQYKLKCDGRRSTLTDERLKLLNDLNFVWSTQRAIWEEKYNELVEYTNVHGHCNVPSNYEPNRPLAIWVRCQRRQYKLFVQRQQEREEGLRNGTVLPSNDDNNINGSITKDRIIKLKALGFSFNPRNLKLRK